MGSADSNCRTGGPTFLLTGGGTAGHINPGLSVAAELTRLCPNARFVWVGTRDRLEARLVPAAGIPIEFIDVSFLKGRGLLGKLGSLMRMPRALFQSVSLLHRYQPQVVVGVGGFASGPVALMASLRGVPTAILEQNARPGMTNRILGPLVERVFLSFEESGRSFSAEKVRLYGNPIRPALLDVASRREREGKDDTFRVLVMGGSQGATALNLDLPQALREVERQGVSIRVRHSAGKNRTEEVRDAYGQACWVEVLEYIDDMVAAYSWADFVICRAGASTVAELTAIGMPAMYVPFPKAADNHQETNARAIVDKQGGLMVSDAELQHSTQVAQKLVELSKEPERLEHMAEQTRKLGRPDAARLIAQEILGLVRE